MGATPTFLNFFFFFLRQMIKLGFSSLLSWSLSSKFLCLPQNIYFTSFSEFKLHVGFRSRHKWLPSCYQTCHPKIFFNLCRYRNCFITQLDLTVLSGYKMDTPPRTTAEGAYPTGGTLSLVPIQIPN